MVTAAADLCAVDLSPGHAVLLADGLVDVPLDRLWEGLRLLVSYEGIIRSARDLALALRKLAGVPTCSPDDAERADAMAAWEQTKRWCARHAAKMYNPVSGIHSLGALEGKTVAEPLPARCEHALRLAGGPQRLLMCRETTDEQWCQKAFCEAYRLAPEIEQSAQALMPADRKVLEMAAGALRSLPGARG